MGDVASILKTANLRALLVHVLVCVFSLDNETKTLKNNVALLLYYYYNVAL